MSSRRVLIAYEWVAEECELWNDEGRIGWEIREPHIAEQLTHLKWVSDPSWQSCSRSTRFRLALVQRHGLRIDGDPQYDRFDGDREYLYVQPDGTLPEHFGSDPEDGYRVPQKYLKEFARHQDWASKLGDLEEPEAVRKVVDKAS